MPAGTVHSRYSPEGVEIEIVRMFVTGCHRSGTSLLASVMAELIARLRPDAPVMALAERSDLEPALDNPNGFFESPQLRQFNDELLALAGCSWDRPSLLEVDWTSVVPHALYDRARVDFRLQALDPYWVDKDPRLALTYRAWTHVFLRRTPLAVVLRDPLEVAVSLYSRNGRGWELDVGLLLWFLYNHHLAMVLQPEDLLVSYQQLMASPADDQCLLAGQISAWLIDQGFPQTSPELCQEALVAMVDPGLDRSAAALEAVPAYSQATEALLRCCQDAYQRVCTAPDGQSCFVDSFGGLPRQVLHASTRHDQLFGVGSLAHGQIDQLQTELANECQAHLQSRQELEASLKQLEEHRLTIQRQQLQLQSLYRSRSWRLMAPLRGLGVCLRSIR